MIVLPTSPTLIYDFLRPSYPQVTLEVKGQVAVTEEVFLYTALSMVAEVGGYVGLFLGVSVNQVAALFEFFLDRRSK